MKIHWNIVRRAGVALFCAVAACGSVQNYLAGSASQDVQILAQEQPIGAVLSVPEETAGQQEALIDLNTATEEELCTLNGIGPVKAQAILAYRQAYGGFVCIEEIMEVKGIGEGTFAKIRDSITVR